MPVSNRADTRGLLPCPGGSLKDYNQLASKICIEVYQMARVSASKKFEINALER
jgi:hypothetical protein